MSLQTRLTNKHAVLCFKNVSDVDRDCILVGNQDATAKFTTVISSSGLSASHFNLPNINSNSTCSVDMAVGPSSNPSIVSPHQFTALTLIENFKSFIYF